MWVRSASEADLLAVHALLVETWHSTCDDILGRELVDTITGSWHSVEALRRNLRKPYSEFVVADSGDGGIDGMAFACQDTEEKASLLQLYVRPTKQLQGLGTMLLEEVEMAFPGVKTMTLEVIERNEATLRFYKRKGYVTTGRTEDWGALNCSEPVLKMEKSLEGWSL